MVPIKEYEIRVLVVDSVTVVNTFDINFIK